MVGSVIIFVDGEDTFVGESSAAIFLEVVEDDAEVDENRRYGARRRRGWSSVAPNRAGLCRVGGRGNLDVGIHLCGLICSSEI